uniref:LITAF domain-containing protein n=1 Tax=Ditylenchus dipsaci TaxID=166011 RepID=A0A915DW62_9BILA
MAVTHPSPYADVNPPHYGNSESKVPPNLAGGFPPSPQFGSGTSGVAQYLTNPSLAPGAPPPPTQPATTRIVISARTALFGPFPVEMDCPYCHNHIVTHTSRVPGILPWIILAVCFVLGFFLLVPWCLCCLPFCVDACLDVLHSCPSCKRLVGRFSRCKNSVYQPTKCFTAMINQAEMSSQKNYLLNI